jgi:hypothetical protein
LGIYFAYPPQLEPGRRGGQETAFAVFDGTNSEPLDGRGVYVDMNGNGVRDKRESLTQAWHRLGLLKPGQPMTLAAYQNCVKNVGAKLVKQGLLPARVGEYYVEKASRTRLLN